MGAQLAEVSTIGLGEGVQGLESVPQCILECHLGREEGKGGGERKGGGRVERKGGGWGQIKIDPV